jgi:hypothetical protein
MKKSVIVYWLIPARAQRELFRSLIRILAKQFEAPKFEPHLTLCLGQDRQSPKKLLRAVKASPLRLQVCGMAHSSKFTKTLFIRLKPDRLLNKLALDLDSKIGSQDPHVSLLYKQLPVSIKKALAATIKLPFRTIVFDSIKAMRCASPATTAANVEAWRVVAIKSLRR